MGTSYRRPKSRAVGLAGGSLWVVAVGGGFAAWSLFSIGPIARHAAYVWVAFLDVCLLIGIFILRKSLRLPPDTAPPTQADKQKAKSFLIVTGAEIAGFAIVNPIAAFTGHFAVMAALNLIVIGLHFIPLAAIFQVRRYLWMGILFCAISIATLLLIPKDRLIGQALAWFVVPSAGCGLAAMVIGGLGMLESARLSGNVARSAGR